MPKRTLVVEKEWGRALARQVASQLPEALRRVPNIRLSAKQIEEIQKAFENKLVANMGCERRHD
jgi:hypothetical protein